MEKYVCIDCKEDKSRTLLKVGNGGVRYYVDDKNLKFCGNICPECKKAIRREYLKNSNNKSSKKYEKTKPGFLMRLYRNMKSRTSGVQKKKFHLYEGKFLLEKEDFYAWANASEAFHSLFKTWEESGYNRKLAPSVDRIDSSLGYYLTNMEWVTMSVNSSRGTISRFQRAGTNLGPSVSTKPQP